MRSTDRFIFQILLFFLLLCATSQAHGSAPAAGCLSCHEGIEVISPTHAFSCEKCHGGVPGATQITEAHRGLVPNPSDPAHAPKRCGRCHPTQVERVSRSLMATAAGEINTTRYLWGAQEDAGARYGTMKVDGTAVIPEVEKSGELVDDLLRRKCLRCHLNTRGALRKGEFRASGCAACHVLYSDDGLSQSNDKAIKGHTAAISKGKQGVRRGYPLKHRITTAIPASQCLHCHNGNRVGMDYVGLFERDEDENYRFLSPDGQAKDFIYGIDHHALIPDIHYERGLACIDCHTQRELMGDGKIHNRAWEQLEVRCTDCHGIPRKKPSWSSLPVSTHWADILRSNPHLKGIRSKKRLRTSLGGWLVNVIKEKNGAVLISKLDGRRHPPPILAEAKEQPVSHRIPQHINRMECHSCHAAWTTQDYGLHLVLQESPGYGQWAHLRFQNDPQIQALLKTQLPLPPEDRSPPETRDWLTARKSLGAWFAGRTYRRWEGRILGLDSRGLTACFRPDAQFVVSYVDLTGEVLRDSWIPRTRDGKRGWAFNPFVPHTQRRKTVSCEGCHGKGAARALGLGPAIISETSRGRISSLQLTQPQKDGLPMNGAWEQIVDISGHPLQHSTHPGARPFSREELSHLIQKSSAYRGYRIIDMKEEGLYRVLREP